MFDIAIKNNYLSSSTVYLNMVSTLKSYLTTNIQISKYLVQFMIDILCPNDYPTYRYSVFNSITNEQWCITLLIYTYIFNKL